MRELKDDLHQYALNCPDESGVVTRFLSLLQHSEAFLRTHLPGHITGSAFIVDNSRSHTLLVHHAKLNKWLQPGGHADDDRNVLRVALREAVEETGVTHFDVVGEDIFDLDIHPIPARADFPAHGHYDVRYLVKASMEAQIIVSEESHDVKWVPLAELEELNNEESLIRMKWKLLQMRS